MNRDLWPEVETLFAAALEQPVTGREAFVHARASSAEVAHEVLSLLASHLRSSVFDPLTARQDALEEKSDHTAGETTARYARLRDALANRYRIERELGRGGMATVYLALDLRHDRQVAIKVLGREVAAAIGSERFLQEIRVTAHLQHPHILALFDSGEVEGFLFYVMPYLEGESLRHKLAREKQLPVDEAVEIARAVAAALDYAHRQQVIHRDVKPENILLHEGQALVADFGIALAVAQASGSRLTETGLSLGTPQYMSPEQITGDREIDARSDIYALGAVLYEMLTGEPPYTGPSAQAIMTRAVTEDPRPVTLARRTVPAHVAACVHQALSRLPADRFATAAQFAEALTNPAFALPAASPRMPGRVTPPTWRRVAWPAAAVAAALAVAAFGWLRGSAGPAPIMRQTIVLGSVGREPASVLLGTAIAPDGSAIVFVDSSGTGPQLWIKERARLDPAPLAGTIGADLGVAFSPDAGWIAYGVGRQIKKLPRLGGTSVTLSDSGGAMGLAWLDDGTIVFAGDEARGLYRVSSQGGPTERLLSGQDIGRGVGIVSPLPDARGVLFTGLTPSFDDSDLMVFDLTTGDVRTLIAGAGWGAYAATGHLVYALRNGSLWAAPLDLRDYRLGPAVPLEDGIRTVVGLAEATLGADGTLLYVRGEDAGGTGTLVLVDRDGSATAVDSDFSLPGLPFGGGLRLSPDGSRLALTLPGDSGDARGPTYDVYVKRFPAGPATRMTFDGRSNRRPSWSPDGTQLLFISNRGGQGDKVWSKRADGGGTVSLVAEEGRQIFEAEWSRDGRWLVYRTDDDQEGAGRRDILAIRAGGDAAPIPLVATDAEETSPALSWDSRWLAYASDETGRKEIYVRPFPNTEDGKWLISTSGGTEPVWTRSGRELFYRDAADNMVVASVAARENSFEVLERRVLFNARLYVGDDNHRFYDVSPDGERFIMISFAAAGAPGDLIMVSNFIEVLRGAARR